MEMPKPQAEHQWLHKLIGEWKFEVVGSCAPGEEPHKHAGKEVVRSFGGLWTIGEATAEMPTGDASFSIMTLGYDPLKQRFVGNFVASMMNFLWQYEGSLDAAEKVLTLDTIGPSFAGDGTMATYQDIIEFIADDHRTLTSRVRGEDGSWTQFMEAHYYRQR